MKKLLIAFALILACATAATAQRTELTISYGGYTQMDASDCHDGWGDVKNAWGALTAGVNFRLTDRLWAGPSYTFSSTTTKGGSARSHIAYHAILANGRYDYYRSGMFTMYAHVGLGVIVSYMQPRGGDNYSCTYFGMQLSPLGVRAALNNKVSLFGELGYGAQGLLQVGVRIGL